MPSRSRNKRHGPLRTPEQVERDARAVQLRKMNYTYDQIARQLGFQSKSSAHDAVRRGLADSVMEANEEVRQQEAERLDDLARKAWTVIHGKHYRVHGNEILTDADGNPLLDTAPVLRGIDTMLKIMTQRATLLGLNAPTQVEVLTMNTIDAEIKRLTAEIQSMAEETADLP